MRCDREEMRSSEWVEFDNEDIVIIDPCYALDRDKCEKAGILIMEEGGISRINYSQLDKVGFSKWLVRGTIDGDQSGYVVDSDSNIIIGPYGIDSAQWAVFSLKELLIHDLTGLVFLNSIPHMWTAITSFTGKVRIEVHYRNDFREEDEDCDKFFDSIVGVGNKNFYTVQQSYDKYPRGLSREDRNILESLRTRNIGTDIKATLEGIQKDVAEALLRYSFDKETRHIPNEEAYNYSWEIDLEKYKEYFRKGDSNDTETKS